MKDREVGVKLFTLVCTHVQRGYMSFYYNLANLKFPLVGYEYEYERSSSASPTNVLLIAFGIGFPKLALIVDFVADWLPASRSRHRQSLRKEFQVLGRTVNNSVETRNPGATTCFGGKIKGDAEPIFSRSA